MKRLTTIDNPWNPFTNWDEWLVYDIKMGYCTNERLARATPAFNESLPDFINDANLDKAIAHLIKTGAIDRRGNRVGYRIVEEKDVEVDDGMPVEIDSEAYDPENS